MPVIDGLLTCRLLRENAKTEDMPIIFFTAKHLDAESIARDLNIGATDYVLKPYTTCHELGQLLSTMIGCLELLHCEDNSDPKYQEILDRMYGNMDELVSILRKFQSIERYKTKSYVTGIEMIDLDYASGKHNSQGGVRGL